jgi:calcineurin-like phosphoesterase family protein
MIDITLDTFIISDTHFGHANILKYEPMRKVWLGDYPDRRLCELWNETIRANDTVLHLGDYVWKGEEIERYTKKLNGQKYLLRGNHDRGAQIYLNNGFLEVIDYKSKGEAAYHIAQVDGLRILFSHYPIISDGFDYVYWRTLSKVFEEEECDINIHGHVHSMVLGDSRCINASLEAIGFAPIRLGTLLETHKERVG